MRPLAAPAGRAAAWHIPGSRVGDLERGRAAARRMQAIGGVFGGALGGVEETPPAPGFRVRLQANRCHWIQNRLQGFGWLAGACGVCPAGRCPAGSTRMASAPREHPDAADGRGIRAHAEDPEGLGGGQAIGGAGVKQNAAADATGKAGRPPYPLGAMCRLCGLC